MGHILVVDDDDMICEVLAMALADEGHQVRCAATVERALHLVAEQAPDVILVDMWLPDGDGAEFIDRYRQLPNATATLVAVSGIAKLDEEVANIGVDAALSKPFDLDDLLALVDRAVGASPAA